MQKTFIVTNTTLDLLSFYRKYVALRPSNSSSRRFFIQYHAGKCSNQVVGLHSIAKVPFLIAQYLELPDPSSYTGHCFRRSPASLLGGTGDISGKHQSSMEIVREILDIKQEKVETGSQESVNTSDVEENRSCQSDAESDMETSPCNDDKLNECSANTSGKFL